MDTQKYLNKQSSNGKIISLEDQMISVLINTNLSWDIILKLSIRKFVKILERYDKELHYRIYKQASMSGFVEFKNPIVHYLYSGTEDKYSHLVTDYNEFKEKMNNVSNINKGGK